MRLINIHSMRWIRLTALGAVAGLLNLYGCASTSVPAPASQPVKQEIILRVDSLIQQQFDQALVSLKAADYSTAIDLLHKVVAKEQRFAAPYTNLGMAYARNNDTAHAEEFLRKAVEIDLGNTVANNELGMLYRKLGRFDDARHAYENALAQHPDYLPARKNLGILCDIYLRDLDCALQQYERFLEYVPDDKTVSIWIVDIKRRAGQ